MIRHLLSYWPLLLPAVTLASFFFVGGWACHAALTRADEHARTVDQYQRRLAAVRRATTPRCLP